VSDPTTEYIDNAMLEDAVRLAEETPIRVLWNQAAMEQRLGQMWLETRPDNERNRREFPDLYGPLEDE
jgi:hypothetical protein